MKGKEILVNKFAYLSHDNIVVYVYSKDWRICIVIKGQLERKIPLNLFETKFRGSRENVIKENWRIYDTKMKEGLIIIVV